VLAAFISSHDKSYVRTGKDGENNSPSPCQIPFGGGKLPAARGMGARHETAAASHLLLHHT